MLISLRNGARSAIARRSDRSGAIGARSVSAPETERSERHRSARNGAIGAFERGAPSLIAQITPERSERGAFRSAIAPLGTERSER